MTEARQDQLVLTDETLNTHCAEAYRALRANISFSSIDRPVKTILVTSAAPREGKTTTVINLGIIMAQAGSRVLIVDADFRRPSLHHIFGFLPKGKRALPGLSNLIVGNSTLDQVRLPSGFARVSLVPAGIAPPNPTELISSQRMNAVVAEVAEDADRLGTVRVAGVHRRSQTEADAHEVAVLAGAARQKAEGVATELGQEAERAALWVCRADRRWRIDPPGPGRCGDHGCASQDTL